MKRLDEGDAEVLRAVEKHQVQNIQDKGVTVLEVSFPYRPEDVVRVEDPYEEER